MSWENYGDVNPIEHGGIFIKKDTEDFPRCYYVVRIDYNEEAGHFWLQDLYVDLNDDWFEWDAVHSYADTSDVSDDIDKVIALISYYSYLEFGTAYEVQDYDEVVKALKEFGIEVK